MLTIFHKRLCREQDLYACIAFNVRSLILSGPVMTISLYGIQLIHQIIVHFLSLALDENIKQLIIHCL